MLTARLGANTTGLGWTTTLIDLGSELGGSGGGGGARTGGVAQTSGAGGGATGARGANDVCSADGDTCGLTRERRAAAHGRSGWRKSAQSAAGQTYDRMRTRGGETGRRATHLRRVAQSLTRTLLALGSRSGRGRPDAGWRRADRTSCCPTAPRRSDGRPRRPPLLRCPLRSAGCRAAGEMRQRATCWRGAARTRQEHRKATAGRRPKARAGRRMGSSGRRQGIRPRGASRPRWATAGRLERAPWEVVVRSRNVRGRTQGWAGW